MNCSKWKIPQTFTKAPELLLEAGYSHLLAALLFSRGIETPAEAEMHLERGVDMLCDPYLLNDMHKAVSRIGQAIDKGEKTAVFGDYDVDGITASCLMADYLRSCGLDCEIYIPDRIDEGYGINDEAISALHERGVSLVISVDCGVTAITEAESANSLDMDIIVTDHHECPEILPYVAAVINPKRRDSTYPNDILAGVGVAFKLVCAHSGDTPSMLERYSDLVAVGTVADVMPLLGENRVLVYKGLQKLVDSPRPGFAALMKESGVAGKPINSTAIAFSIAPRINAAGRLCRTDIALSLLLAESEAEAEHYAAELSSLNRRRQDLESKVWKESVDILGSEVLLSPIVLGAEGWHPGVVGIAASRLAAEYKLPAVIISFDGDNGKGSCRSYGDFKIFEALSACSEYLDSFGGHAFAAGLNIQRKNLDAFRSALAGYYHAYAPSEQPLLEPELLLSELDSLTMEDIESLEVLEPCGEANPRPVICVCGVVLESVTPIGKGKHLKIRITKNGHKLDCVYFAHTVESLGVSEGGIADICFVPQINEFRSLRKIQLLVSDIRPSELFDHCRGILDGSYVPDADNYLDRDMLADIWRGLIKRGVSFVIEPTVLFDSEDFGTDPLTTCLCIKIFEELDLLGLKINESSLSIMLKENASKTQLENSSLFRRFSKS